MVAPPEVPRNAGRKAKGHAKCDGIDRKERGQGHYKGRDTPKDTPARARVCLLLLYRLYGQASLVILDPRAELERLRMLKEYDLGADVLQGDQFAPLA